MKSSIKIALDVMGGDYAPLEVIKGAILAQKEMKDISLVLVGDKFSIEKYLKRLGDTQFLIKDAPEVIRMEDPPALSIRKKKNSSIVEGINLLKSGEVQGFVSAGNTGAVVCASTLYLGLLEGIQRPGIGVLLPTLKGMSFMIDVGANIDPKPFHLLQYAIMGDAYFRIVWGKKRPKIGLLNIGEEETKGTDFLKECYNLLSQSELNFLGNIEAKDIFSGKCDVIICDGFVGNIALKVSEGLAETLTKFLKQFFKKNIVCYMGAFLIRPFLKDFFRSIDYAEYGGAPLLGIKGTVIICHGRSKAKAIKNAIKVARSQILSKLNKNIIELINA